jgi:hypothetical protein
MLREVIEQGEEVPLKTFGVSMKPFIHGGELIAVRKVDAGELGVGDVAVYQAGNRFVAHRVIRRREQRDRIFFTVKGDAHLAAEGEIAAEDVVAKVVALKKGGTRIDLDSPRWRLTNWLIAIDSSLVNRVCGGRADRYDVSGADSSRPPVRLVDRAASRLSRTLVGLLMGRWANCTVPHADGTAEDRAKVGVGRENRTVSFDSGS